MPRKLPNPTLAGIFMDSCAFDPKYSPEDAASNELFKLSKLPHRTQRLPIVIAHSTLKEIHHPNTPLWVRQLAATQIFTDPTSLTFDEQTVKTGILRVLTGTGKAENMSRDADHVFEAYKYSSYFVTTDAKILKRKDALRQFCRVEIMKPRELLDLYRERNGS